MQRGRRVDGAPASDRHPVTTPGEDPGPSGRGILVPMKRAAAAAADDPTPDPSSAVTTSAPLSPASPEYFADATPAVLTLEAAIGAAYDEGRALYGDEDGDAWLAALESGVHPLCRIKTAALSS